MKDIKGFTLTELLIVVALIGILLAIAMPNYLRFLRSARDHACISNIREIKNAAIIYLHADMVGSDPTNLAVSDLVPDYIRTEPVCPLGFTTTLPGGGPHPGGGSPPGRRQTYEIITSGNNITVRCPNADPQNHDVNE